MSAKVKQAGKFTGKAIGLVVFTILFAFNIQVAFSDDASGEIDFLGIEISLNDVLALPVQADDYDDGGGGGGNLVKDACQTTPPCSRTEWGVMWVPNGSGVLIPVPYIYTRTGNEYRCVGTCLGFWCLVAPCDA